MDKYNNRNKSRNSRQNLDKTNIYNPRNYRPYDDMRDTMPRRKPVEQRKPNTNRRAANSSMRKPSNKKPVSRYEKHANKSKYMAFYLLTLLAAILICIGVFLAVFNMVTNSGGKGLGSGAEKPPNGQVSGPIIATNEITTIGMIHSKDARNNTLEVLDIENEHMITFTIDTSTQMRGRTGESLTFADFNVGDIVDFRYPEAGSVISSMAQSPRAWEQRQITGARINTDSNSIIWGNESYSYTKNLKVIYNNQDIRISEVEPNSVITMRGMGRNIWYILVERGIGVLEFVNADEIQDGVLEFEGAQSVSFLIDSLEDNKVSILDGSYKVTIRGSNIVPFVMDVFVVSGQSTTLDLSQIEIVAGILNVSVNILDAEVFIDGERIRVSEPQVLNYGVYKISATHPNYEKYEEVIEIDSLEKNLKIELVEAVVFTRVSITSNPEGANVYIDDAFIGVTPLSVPLDIRSNLNRELTVRKEGYHDMTVRMFEGQDIYRISLIQDSAYSNEPVIDDDLDDGE